MSWLFTLKVWGIQRAIHWTSTWDHLLILGCACLYISQCSTIAFHIFVDVLFIPSNFYYCVSGSNWGIQSFCVGNDSWLLNLKKKKKNMFDTTGTTVSEEEKSSRWRTLGMILLALNEKMYVNDPLYKNKSSILTSTPLEWEREAYRVRKVKKKKERKNEIFPRCSVPLRRGYAFDPFPQPKSGKGQ